ncbi:RING finger containing protein [Cryptosporidium felis]|nr:RING finger containing protein [Cryptosporidium felis]
MNLQGQRRGISHNKSSQIANGKKNNLVIGNCGTFSQEDRFPKSVSGVPRATGFSPSIGPRVKSFGDEENRLSVSFQQVVLAGMSEDGANRSQASTVPKQQALGVGTATASTASASALTTGTVVDHQRERQFLQTSKAGGAAANLVISSGAPPAGEPKKKRSRVIYCHVCCQYKPRSTRARFQVCQHIACYDCVRLALMIQQRYGVKAHCPFCQMELDWNKVKPFIVLFKPKAESPEDSGARPAALQNEEEAGQEPDCVSDGGDADGSAAQNDSGLSNSAASQTISNDLIAQAFECNGVSKEKILKGFFSCYLQKNACGFGGPGANLPGFGPGPSQARRDPREPQSHVSRSFSGDARPGQAFCGGGGVGTGTGGAAAAGRAFFHAPSSPAIGGQGRSLLHSSKITASSESSVGTELLPEMGLPPNADLTCAPSYMHPAVAAEHMHACNYVEGLGASGLNCVVRVSGCGCFSCSRGGGEPQGAAGFGTGGSGFVSGLGQVPVGGGVLSAIYDENNRRGFACGLFSPSIPTDGGPAVHQAGGKSGEGGGGFQGHYLPGGGTGGFLVSSLGQFQGQHPGHSHQHYHHHSQSGEHRLHHRHGGFQTYQSFSVLDLGLEGGFVASPGDEFSDGSVRLGASDGVLGLFEPGEDKQVSSWMVTAPCLNMRDILGDWRSSTLLKSHSDMVICSI